MRTPRTAKNARATHEAQLVAIDTLKPYPGNARTHDLDVIRESLRVNTQYRPIVVRSRTRHVLAGNGTLEAALAEGWTEIWATFIDCDAKAARRINLVDNRANDLAGWDEQLLAAQLGEIPELDGTGYGEQDLAHLVAALDGHPIGDERYTPAWVFEAMGLQFDLDVAAPGDAADRVVPAKRYLTIRDDGLTAAWNGLVWMNPPYSQAAAWARRWIEHPNGVCLMPMSEADWTPDLLAKSTGFVLLPKIRFTTRLGSDHIDRLVFVAARGSGASGVQQLAERRDLPIFTGKQATRGR